jgi:RNA polymerase sigma factor (sigma-70 family)
MSLLQNHPELLSAYRAGDDAALASIYRHYSAPLAAYCRSLARGIGNAELCQPSAVQDVMQEAFMRAFSKPARLAYDGQRDFLPYLKAIARNCALNALRRRSGELLFRHERLRGVGEALSNEYGYEPDVLATLEAYLSSLPPALKDLYEQRFERELSQESASAALGLTRRSLRTLEARFTRGLRRALAVAGHFPERPAATPRD